MTDFIQARADQAAFDRAVGKLNLYRDAPLRQRTEKGQLEAAKVAVPIMRRMAPRGRTGKHRRSIRARQGRRGGWTRAGLAGPTDFKRHWLVRGTAGHSLATKRPGKSAYAVIGLGRVTRSGRGLEGVGIRPTKILRHPGSKSHPYVEEVARRYRGPIVRRLIAGVTDVR